jgi:hypothetical protein
VGNRPSAVFHGPGGLLQACWGLLGPADARRSDLYAYPRQLCAPLAPTKDGRTVRAFNPLSRNERLLFAVLLAEEHALHGFTNRDVRKKLRLTSYPLAPDEARMSTAIKLREVACPSLFAAAA